MWDHSVSARQVIPGPRAAWHRRRLGKVEGKTQGNQTNTASTLTAERLLWCQEHVAGLIRLSHHRWRLHASAVPLRKKNLGRLLTLISSENEMIATLLSLTIVPSSIRPPSSLMK